MDTKNNFSQAVKELLGTKQSENNLETGRDADNKVDNKQEKSSDLKLNNSNIPPIPAKTKIPGPATVISKGTVIIGKITSDTNIELFGSLKGNVETTENLKLCGKLLGDAKGSTIDLVSCQMQGNISSSDNINIDSESIVIGNISAESIILDGKVKGNLNIKKNAIIKDKATLLGNINAEAITISDGAELQGEIKITQDQVKVNSTKFEFGIEDIDTEKKS